MLDIRFVRENPDKVKENIKNKFQDEKLSLVDEVIALDEKKRKTQVEADGIRASRNKLSKEIGKLMGQGKKEEAEAVKAQVSANAARLAELEGAETDLDAKILKMMMTIPNIIDPSVPIGKDDSENVEIERFGEPVIPYPADYLDCSVADRCSQEPGVSQPVGRSLCAGKKICSFPPGKIKLMLHIIAARIYPF